jgi:hypothetical protein
VGVRGVKRSRVAVTYDKNHTTGFLDNAMKKELIEELFQQFEEACYIYNDLECWSARELQEILGYAKWDNFKNAVEKAKKSCENAGFAVSDHFADVGKMIEIGKGGQREVDDIANPLRLLSHCSKRRFGKKSNRLCANLFRGANPQTGNYRTTAIGCRPRQCP